jgi:RNA recognition motif. (a.k.a. RRM, RBD, or RNP domain)
MHQCINARRLTWTGFAFVEYGDRDSARDAIMDMNGKKIFDKVIRVQLSKRGILALTQMGMLS